MSVLENFEIINIDGKIRAITLDAASLGKSFGRFVSIHRKRKHIVITDVYGEDIELGTENAVIAFPKEDDVILFLMGEQDVEQKFHLVIDSDENE